MNITVCCCDKISLCLVEFKFAAKTLNSRKEGIQISDKLWDQIVVSTWAIFTVIYIFNALGFEPGSSGRYTGTKIGKRQLYRKGETLHKTIQKQRMNKIRKQKTQNRNKHGKIYKKNIKNILKN